jgi:hypothetical protein
MQARRTVTAGVSLLALVCLGACEPEPPTPTVPATTTQPPSNVVARVDAATGLPTGRVADAPEGATIDDSIKGEAAITVEGDVPLALSDGLCSFMGPTLFIQAGEASRDFITLSFTTADRSMAAITDTNHISDRRLGWRSNDTTAMSVPDDFDIIFDEGGGVFGSFSGRATLSQPDVATTDIEFHGRFSCTPAPFEVRGAHGIHPSDVRCDSERGIVSAGGRTGDAAVLAYDPAALMSPEPLIDAALSVRSGTERYTSTWVIAEMDLDGLAGTFAAGMVGNDGVEFTVSGGFDCPG